MSAAQQQEPRVVIGAGAETPLATAGEEENVEVEVDREQLLRRVKAGEFDVVIVDLRMPRLKLEDLRTLMERGVRVVPAGATRMPDFTVPLNERLNRVFVRMQSASSSLVRPRSEEEQDQLRKRALAAAFQERSRMLEGGLSAPEVAKLLGTSRQTPHDRTKANSLLAIQDNGELRFPPWQFDPNGPNGVVPGLPDILRALSVGALAKARWLQTPNPVLDDRSPLQALKEGDLDRVLVEARGVGAQAGARDG